MQKSLKKHCRNTKIPADTRPLYNQIFIQFATSNKTTLSEPNQITDIKMSIGEGIGGGKLTTEQLQQQHQHEQISFDKLKPNEIDLDTNSVKTSEGDIENLLGGIMQVSSCPIGRFFVDGKGCVSLAGDLEALSTGKLDRIDEILRTPEMNMQIQGKLTKKPQRFKKVTVKYVSAKTKLPMQIKRPMKITDKVDKQAILNLEMELEMLLKKLENERKLEQFKPIEYDKIHKNENEHGKIDKYFENIAGALNNSNTKLNSGKIHLKPEFEQMFSGNSNGGKLTNLQINKLISNHHFKPRPSKEIKFFPNSMNINSIGHSMSINGGEHSMRINNDKQFVDQSKLQPNVEINELINSGVEAISNNKVSIESQNELITNILQLLEKIKVQNQNKMDINSDYNIEIQQGHMDINNFGSGTDYGMNINSGQGMKIKNEYGTDSGHNMEIKHGQRMNINNFGSALSHGQGMNINGDHEFKINHGHVMQISDLGNTMSQHGIQMNIDKDSHFSQGGGKFEYDKMHKFEFGGTTNKLPLIHIDQTTKIVKPEFNANNHFNDLISDLIRQRESLRIKHEEEQKKLTKLIASISSPNMKIESHGQSINNANTLTQEFLSGLGNMKISGNQGMNMEIDHHKLEPSKNFDMSMNDNGMEISNNKLYNFGGSQIMRNGQMTMNIPGFNTMEIKHEHETKPLEVENLPEGSSEAKTTDELTNLIENFMKPAATSSKQSSNELGRELDNLPEIEEISSASQVINENAVDEGEIGQTFGENNSESSSNEDKIEIIKEEIPAKVIMKAKLPNGEVMQVGEQTLKNLKQPFDIGAQSIQSIRQSVAKNMNASPQNIKLNFGGDWGVNFKSGSMQMKTGKTIKPALFFPKHSFFGRRGNLEETQTTVKASDTSTTAPITTTRKPTTAAKILKIEPPRVNNLFGSLSDYTDFGSNRRMGLKIPTQDKEDVTAIQKRADAKYEKKSVTGMTLPDKQSSTNSAENSKNSEAH